MAETLFLAVSFLDRFLSVESVPRTLLQLAGITAILVAAKYEEIYAPTVRPCYLSAGRQPSGGCSYSFSCPATGLACIARGVVASPGTAVQLASVQPAEAWLAVVDSFTPCQGSSTDRQRLKLCPARALRAAPKCRLGLSRCRPDAQCLSLATPQVEELCYITDNTYTRQDMLAMERRLLSALGFQCTVPTSRVFVRRFVQAAAPDFGDVRCAVGLACHAWDRPRSAGC